MANTVSIIRGDTWLRTWALKNPAKLPIDLTGATARLQVRSKDGVLLASAATTDGRIIISGVKGQIDLVMPPSVTSLFEPLDENYDFDIELTYATGIVKTLEIAELVVRKDITRA